MSANPVNWFEIYVQDMDRATAFYEQVFDMKISPMPAGDLVMNAFPMSMGAPGAAGALVRMNGMPSGGNSTIIYFHSEDCATEEARVVDAGGRIHRGKTPIGQYGAITLAYDTEGNMFGIHSQK